MAATRRLDADGGESVADTQQWQAQKAQVLGIIDAALEDLPCAGSDGPLVSADVDVPSGETAAEGRPWRAAEAASAPKSWQANQGKSGIRKRSPERIAETEAMGTANGVAFS